MIPQSYGSILFQDSSLNRTHRENCYISCYEGPNEIYQDVPEKARNAIFVVQVSYPEYETVTHGSQYNFAMLNNPETSHLGRHS